MYMCSRGHIYNIPPTLLFFERYYLFTELNPFLKINFKNNSQKINSSMEKNILNVFKKLLKTILKKQSPIILNVFNKH